MQAFGGNGGSNTSTTSGGTQLPSWLNAGSQQLVNEGQNAASRAYTGFSGQGVAPLSGNQNAAIGNAGSMSTAYQPLLSQGGLTSTSQNIAAFANPYVQGVLGPQASQINQTYDKQQTALNQAKPALDAYGGAGAAGAQSNLNAQRTAAMNNAMATGKANAFQSGLSNLEQTRATAQQAGALVDSQLGTTGAMDRQTQQNQADYDYSNYLAQQNWGTNNLQYLMQAIGGAKGDTSTSTNSTTTNSANGLGGLMSTLGTVASIAAMAFSDERVKKDIKKVGKIPTGEGLYKFRYKNEPSSAPKHTGVLAQEVEKKHPEVVHELGGVKAVDYAALGRKQQAAVNGKRKVRPGFYGVTQ